MRRKRETQRRAGWMGFLSIALCLTFVTAAFGLGTSYTPIRLTGTDYNWVKAAVPFDGMHLDRPMFSASRPNVLVIVLYDYNQGAYRWVCQIIRLSGSPDICTVFFNDTDSPTPPGNGWYVAYEFGDDPYEGAPPTLAGGRPHPIGR